MSGTNKAENVLNEFRILFTGNDDNFVVHLPPFTKNEKGKVSAKAVFLQQYGKGSFKDIPPEYEEGDYVPLTIEQYRQHLNGEQGLAVSPLIGKVEGEQDLTDVCRYGIIDIDVPDYDYLPLINRLYSDGFKFMPVKSKSSGLHLYFFFSYFKDAEIVRKSLRKIVDIYGLDIVFSQNHVTKVEIFPDHDKVTAGKNDKHIFLPYFDVKETGFNQAIDTDGNLLSITQALKLARSMTISLETLEATIKKLPYNDAPYCLQALFLNGDLYEGSHRNDFIFTFAVYLKQKAGSEGLSVTALSEVNARLAEPLPLENIEGIVNSIKDTDYPLLGQCKKEPMCEFCNKALCKQRAFSAVHKEKNNVSSNIQFGKIFRMLAEEPYYLIEGRLVGENESESTPFVRLRADGAEQLLNQRYLQRECIDKLGQTMWTVKQAIWEQRINELLVSIENVEVPRETDTSELSDLRELFHRYMTHKQAQSRSPFRVTQKQVYVEDGVYYFQTDGIKDYLRVMQYNTKGTNLREQLLQYGCVEGELRYIKADKSIGTIKCWTKAEDEYLKDLAVYYDELDGQDDNDIQTVSIDRDEYHDNEEDNFKERF